MITSRDRKPAALSIAGLDPSGGAGVIADARTFDALDVHPMAAVSAITYQNSRGVLGWHQLAVEVIRSQIGAVVGDRVPEAVKIGMLGSPGCVSEVARALNEYCLERVVIDPVLQSGGGFPLIERGGVEVMLDELVPLAALLTPNVRELAGLSGIEISGVDSAKEAAVSLAAAGAGAVLATGIRLERRGAVFAVDILHDGDGFSVFERPWSEGLNVHGTGCVLSSAVAAGLALGRDLHESVESALEFVEDAIGSAVRYGEGMPSAEPGSKRSRR